MGRAYLSGPSRGRFSPLPGAVSIGKRCGRDASPTGAHRVRGAAKGVAILLSPPPSRKTRASEKTLDPIPSRCGTSEYHRRDSYRAWRAYRSSWSPGWGSSCPASRGTLGNKPALDFTSLLVSGNALPLSWHPADRTCFLAACGHRRPLLQATISRVDYSGGSVRIA
jgi:hypothetical protein